MKGFFIVLLLLAALPQCNATETKQKNKSVNFQIDLKQKSLKPGSKGTLLISLIPKNGIHINLETPTSIKFDSSDSFISSGNLILPKNQKDSYLDTTKKIEQSITIAKNVKSGTISVKGTLTYFFCSDTEGWCSKFKQPFEVAVTIVK